MKIWSKTVLKNYDFYIQNLDQNCYLGVIFLGFSRRRSKAVENFGQKPRNKIKILDVNFT